MKYEAKKHWAIDIVIESNRSDLCCEEVIGYVRELYKALSANGNACGVSPYIGDEYYHDIYIWGDANGNTSRVIALCADMAAAGCFVDTVSGR